MTKSLIFLVLLVAFSVVAAAQKVYNYRDKRFIYKVAIDSVLSPDSISYNGVIKSVRVVRRSDNKTIQTIHPPESNFFWNMDKDVVFKAEDVNFDGINDIRILNSTGIGANELFYYWLFDKSTKQFKRCKPLEDITSPEPDSKEKLIYSSWTGRWNYHGSSIYKWIKGRPVLIGENDVIQGGDDKNPSDTILTKKRIKGKMRLVKKTIE